MKGIVWLGISSIIGLLIYISQPVVIRSPRNVPLIDAISHGRQLGVALFEFESDYGTVPDASTIAAVKAKTGSTWTFGTATSNDLLKQLIATGIVQSEEVFYAEGNGMKKPDNHFANEADALAPGECGFAYIPAAFQSKLASSPVLVAPLIPGTFRFDPVPFKGRAVVVRADSSVQHYPIAPDGHIARGGVDLFDPSQPWWMGKPPMIVWPALLPPSPPAPPPVNYTPWIAGAVVILILFTLPIAKLHRRQQPCPIPTEPTP